MKLVKAALSSICAFAIICTATGVMSFAESNDYTPSFYNDNYIIINDFTTEEQLPSPTNFHGNGIKNPELSIDSGTPSPDGTAAALPLNENGNNYYILTDMQDYTSELPTGMEALAVWYSFPAPDKTGSFDNCVFVAIDGEADDIWVKPTFIVAGEESKKNPGVLVNTTGYMLLEAADLNGHDIKDIKSIYYSLPGWAGFDNTNVADQTLYIDDVGAVADLAAFKAAIKQKHDISALEAAITEAQLKREANYTAESWEIFAEVLDAAKTTRDELKNLYVYEEAMVAPMLRDLVLELLQEAVSGLEEIPSGGGDNEKPPYYDDNFIVINDFTDATKLPKAATWGHKPYYDGTLATDSGTPSPDGKAAALLLNSPKGNNTFYLPLDTSDLAEGMEALVLWYSFPSEDTTATGAFNFYVNIQFKDEKQATWVPLTIITDGKETNAPSTQSIASNTTGYIILKASDLLVDGTAYDITDIDFIFNQVGDLDNSDVAGQTLYIDDLAAVKSIDAFKAHLLGSVSEGPLPAGTDIKAEAAAQATLVDASWNAFTGAHSYKVTIYTQNNDQYSIVKSDTTTKLQSTITGLKGSTKYFLQVVALNANEESLSASNVVGFTTLDKNILPSMLAPIDYDKDMLANKPQISGTNATITWGWVSGVHRYTVYLYTLSGDAYTFVAKEDAGNQQGAVTFTGLDASKTYVAQVVAYDMSDSVIFAYKPLTVTLTDGGDDGDDGKIPNANTGVSFPLAVLALAAGSALTVSVAKKRKA